MGLFGGGNRTDLNTTNVTTETSTSIRDIGFTGDQALQMAGLLENANIARQQIQYQSMNSFNDYVQSTNDLTVRSSAGAAQDILSATGQTGQNILDATLGALEGIIATTGMSQEAASSAQQSAYELQRQATGAQGPALTADKDITTISKQITIIVLGVAALGFLWRVSK